MRQNARCCPDSDKPAGGGSGLGGAALSAITGPGVGQIDSRKAVVLLNCGPSCSALRNGYMSNDIL